MVYITKTRLYNFDPLQPHFYIVKLQGYTLFFLFLLKNIDYGAVLTSTHNLCFEQKYKQYQKILSENFHFLMVKFSIYLNRLVFVMCLSASTSLPPGRTSEGYPVYQVLKGIS